MTEENTSRPQQRQREIVPLQLESPEQLNSRRLFNFWGRYVIGAPNSVAHNFTENTKEQQLDYLHRSLKARLRVLAGELQIPVIQANVGVASVNSLRHFYTQLQTSAHFNETETRNLDQWLRNIEETEQSLGVDNIQTQAMKQRFYLWSIGRRISKFDHSPLDFLPTVCTREKAIDCSLASALGMEIAEMAGIKDAILLEGVDHTVFCVKTADGKYCGYDYANTGKTLKLVPGEDIDTKNHIFQTFRFEKPEDCPEITCRIFVRADESGIVENILNNTHYALGERGFLHLTRPGLQNVQEAKRLREEIQQKYGQKLFEDTRNYYFIPNYSILNQTDVWRKEEKRVLEKR